MTSQPERQSDLLSDEEIQAVSDLAFELYQIGRERDLTCNSQLLETLRTKNARKLERQRTQSVVDRLLGAWQNR